MMITFDFAVKAKLTPEEISSLQKRSAEYYELLRVHGTNPFQPYACYDESLDCVRVVTRDCSACESRITEWLTVLHDNDPESDIAPIGFTLKGVRVLAGTPGGVLNLIELLDAYVKTNPQETIMAWVDMLKKLTNQARLQTVRVPTPA